MPVYDFTAVAVPGSSSIADVLRIQVEMFNKQHPKAKVQSTSLTSFVVTPGPQNNLYIDGAQVVCGLIAYEE